MLVEDLPDLGDSSVLLALLGKAEKGLQLLDGLLGCFNLFLRDCPKSLVGARGVALQTAQKALRDPFRLPHSVRIHLRSVAQTPFRTVSPRSTLAI
jgi:hypothetical protein